MSNPFGETGQQRFVEIMAGRRRGLGPMLLRAAASVAGGAYASVIRARNFAYSHRLACVHKLAKPVISVGNLSAGGTGKTVLVTEIARWLLAAGRQPAILMRGYKGENSAVGSDEAAMLHRALPGVAVIANPDRVVAGRKLLAGDKPPDVFILDDGFQHRRLHRDLDVVALDATCDLAGPLGRVLPRGLMREPRSSLRRADVIVLTRVDQATAPELEHFRSFVATTAPGASVAACRHAAAGLRLGDADRPVAELADRRYVAFCGLGNPDAFRRTLATLPGECVEFVAFADHHAYAAADLSALAELARGNRADVLVTTQKDAVKLAAAPPDPPIYAVRIELAWTEGEQLLRERVAALVRQ
ncbi:MAG: tetraacyldisaccharide 4'-kinase [Phycisphaerae bacterium]|nr:tetraacyldisaccharide 4'-kinase [Phycisphaerae bacterium]